MAGKVKLKGMTAVEDDAIVGKQFKTLLIMGVATGDASRCELLKGRKRYSVYYTPIGVVNNADEKG